eukprot:COSAG02_NODE_284_length_25691_cov_14.733354_10_plen_153_part_00
MGRQAGCRRQLLRQCRSLQRCRRRFREMRATTPVYQRGRWKRSYLYACTQLFSPARLCSCFASRGDYECTCGALQHKLAELVAPTAEKPTALDKEVALAMQYGSSAFIGLLAGVCVRRSHSSSGSVPPHDIRTFAKDVDLCVLRAPVQATFA